MKKLNLLLTFFAIIFVFRLQAQGDLQFNRAITFTNGNNATVPTGKVWKIESVNFSSSLTFQPGALNLSSCSNTVNGSGQVDGRNCNYSSSYMTIGNLQFITPEMSEFYCCSGCFGNCSTTNTVTLSSSSSGINIKSPIWLEAGKSISVVPGTGILISVVEFNIVP